MRTIENYVIGVSIAELSVPDTVGMERMVGTRRDPAEDDGQQGRKEAGSLLSAMCLSQFSQSYFPLCLYSVELPSLNSLYWR
jgi:hypothetical protein